MLHGRQNKTVAATPLPKAAREERLLSKAQAAEFLGVSTRFLDYQRSAGKLRAFRVGRLAKFRLSDLRAFVEKDGDHDRQTTQGDG